MNSGGGGIETLDWPPQPPQPDGRRAAAASAAAAARFKINWETRASERTDRPENRMGFRGESDVST